MDTNTHIVNKQRVVAFLAPDTIQRMTHLGQERGLKNHSEFIGQAVEFYLSFLSCEDATTFLSAALQGALRENLLLMQDRVATNLFRLTVETDMMMHLLAATIDVTDQELYGLRGRCVKEVKNTKGKIKLNDAVRFQQGNEQEVF